MKTLLALGALAGIGIGGGPAMAQDRTRQCMTWRHGQCLQWAGRRERWHVGHIFGPNYGYTDYGALPRPYVARYHLSPRYRYVSTGGTIYVVDPDTYAVRRILNAVSR